MAGIFVSSIPSSPAHIPSVESDDQIRNAEIFVFHNRIEGSANLPKSFPEWLKEIMEHWVLAIFCGDFWIKIEGLNEQGTLNGNYIKDESPPPGTKSLLREVKQVAYAGLQMPDLTKIRVSPKMIHQVAKEHPHNGTKYAPANQCQTWATNAALILEKQLLQNK